MRLFADGTLLEPLREAQGELLDRLDAMLVELRHVHLLLEALLEGREPVSGNGAKPS